MLFIHQKYKPVITKTAMEQDYDTSIMPSVQGKGINELIQKVKDIKVKDNHKKRNSAMTKRCVENAKLRRVRANHSEAFEALQILDTRLTN